MNSKGKVEMSYPFEQLAKESLAVSLLNKMRHWLQGRNQDELSISEHQVLEKVFEIIEFRRFEEMVVNSFQSTGFELSSSIVPISLAIYAITGDDSGKIAMLKKLLLITRLPDNESDKKSAIEFLNQAIQIIGEGSL
jgi:hypothetical protein